MTNVSLFEVHGQTHEEEAGTGIRDWSSYSTTSTEVLTNGTNLRAKKLKGKQVDAVEKETWVSIHPLLIDM